MFNWIYDLYQYSFLYRIRWYITHWIRKDKWVKTELKIGYYDKDSLIENALFTLVSDYVSRSGEDAFSVVEIDSNIREQIIQILYGYHISLPEMTKQIDNAINTSMANVCFDFTDKETHKDCKELVITYINGLTEEESRDNLKNIQKLEKYKIQETHRLLHMCIDIKDYLWV